MFSLLSQNVSSLVFLNSKCMCKMNCQFCKLRGKCGLKEVSMFQNFFSAVLDLGRKLGSQESVRRFS